MFCEADGRLYFNDFGESAIFTPAIGQTIPCKVFLETMQNEEPLGFDIQVATQDGITVEALIADIGRLPVTGETFTIATVIYTVVRTTKTDGFTVTLAVKK